MNRILLRFAAMMVCISCEVFCQPATPAFEVASIKLNPDNFGRQLVQITPGTLTIKKGNLQFLIRWAYNLRRDQIVSPLWFKTELYDIIAKPPAPSTESQLQLMLQSLLADRFKLAFHRESKVVSVYEMVVAKGGPKLVESKLIEDVYRPSTRTAYDLPHVSMSEFATRLGELGAVSLPVVDRTGIAGFFDVTLTFPEGSRPMDRMLNVPVAADIFTIMESQLGLKLQERKVPTDILVIDHAERPSAN